MAESGMAESGMAESGMAESGMAGTEDRVGLVHKPLPQGCTLLVVEKHNKSGSGEAVTSTRSPSAAD